MRARRKAWLSSICFSAAIHQVSIFSLHRPMTSLLISLFYSGVSLRRPSSLWPSLIYSLEHLSSLSKGKLLSGALNVLDKLADHRDVFQSEEKPGLIRSRSEDGLNTQLLLNEAKLLRYIEKMKREVSLSYRQTFNLNSAISISLISTAKFKATARSFWSRRRAFASSCTASSTSSIKSDPSLNSSFVDRVFGRL